MSTDSSQIQAYISERQEVLKDVKGLLAEIKAGTGGINFDPDWIADDEPLFGRGLELDSLDVATLGIALSQKHDVLLTDEQVDAMGSVNRLVDYILSRKPMEDQNA